MKKLLFLLLALPLAACVDADMSMTVHDDDTATVVSVITMTPEAYQFAQQSGEPLCDEGVGEALSNGGYKCVTEDRMTIDELIEELNAQDDLGPDGSITPSDTAKIERLDGGDVRVSFDLSPFKAQVQQSGFDPAMMGMMQQMFAGHGISMKVGGAEIVETNGTLAEDGTSASIRIDLDKLMMLDQTVLDEFVTVIRP